jgi:hypothetical protein
MCVCLCARIHIKTNYSGWCSSFHTICTCTRTCPRLNFTYTEQTLSREDSWHSFISCMYVYIYINAYAYNMLYSSRKPVYIPPYMYMHVFVCIHTHTHMTDSLAENTTICVCVRVYVYVYVYIYIYIHLPTHTHLPYCIPGNTFLYLFLHTFLIHVLYTNMHIHTYIFIYIHTL